MSGGRFLVNFDAGNAEMEAKMEAFSLRRTSGRRIGGPKGSVAVWGRNRRNDTSVFGAILEPRGAIGGPFWELLWTIFATDFRPLFGEPFWLFWGRPDEQKHTNT